MSPSERPKRLASRLAMGLGLGLAGLGVLEPAANVLLVCGGLLAVVGLVLAPRRTAPVWVGASLALGWAVSGQAGPEFRADAGSYFVYLRSALFDRDLDFANDWALLGRPEMAAHRTPTGRVSNSQTVGPAILWSPFALAAHGYVVAGRALGLVSHPPDGASPPYRRALALGTVAYVVLGSALLVSTLAGVAGLPRSVGAVAAAVLATPVVYYTVVVPGMAHGLAFAAAAAFVHAAARVREHPSGKAWVFVGLCLGLLALLRPQAIVLGLLAVPTLVQEARNGRARPGDLLRAGAAAALVASPQLLVWKALYGSFVTVPQGRRYLDWSSPHLRDVLFSADHGLFTWTPVAAVGLVGLLWLARREAAVAAAAVSVFVALAWVNGSVADWDWAGGDAFGARRFDVFVPVIALGLVALPGRALVAALLAALVAWNLGLVTLFREGWYPGPLPFARLAQDQALLFERATLRVAGGIFGTAGRALAYDALRGEYFFREIAPGGVLRLASADERSLRSGFARPSFRDGGPPFRWAHAPEACLEVPLDRDARPAALALLARAPRKALPQVVTVAVNGREAGRLALGAEWTTEGLAVPPGAFTAGPNALCLRFSRALPQGGDPRPAAAIAEVRLGATLDAVLGAPAAPLVGGDEPDR
jgi:hypothetical protein